jgi:hypothetical protein
MKTDFATASSMTILSPSPAYEATVGATVDPMRAPDHVEHCADPADIAAVVMKVAELDDPPVRLLLGAGNYAYARAVEEARLQADERWQWLTAVGDRG